jgi:hypothetical protein
MALGEVGVDAKPKHRIVQPRPGQLDVFIVDLLNQRGEASLTWVFAQARARWNGARLQDVRDFLAHDPSLYTRTNHLGTRVFGVRGSLVQGCPPQVPRFPAIPRGSGLNKPPHLPEGQIQEDWLTLNERLPSNIKAYWTDYVTLRAPKAPTWNVTRVNTDAGIRWIAWVHTNGVGARDYMRHKWHAWKVKDIAHFGEETYRALQASPQERVIVTWTSETATNLMRELISDIMVRVPNVEQLSLETVKVSADVIAAYEKEVARQKVIEQTLAKLGVRIRSKPIRGYCRICGMGLSDAISLKRGIGPDCYAKIAHLDQAALKRHADGVILQVRARTVQEWVGLLTRKYLIE